MSASYTKNPLTFSGGNQGEAYFLLELQNNIIPSTLYEQISAYECRLMNKKGWHEDFILTDAFCSPQTVYLHTTCSNMIGQNFSNYKQNPGHFQDTNLVALTQIVMFLLTTLVCIPGSCCTETQICECWSVTPRFSSLDLDSDPNLPLILNVNVNTARHMFHEPKVKLTADDPIKDVWWWQHCSLTKHLNLIPLIEFCCIQNHDDREQQRCGPESTKQPQLTTYKTNNEFKHDAVQTSVQQATIIKVFSLFFNPYNQLLY